MPGGGSIRLLWLATALALFGAPAAAQASVGNFAMAFQQDGKILIAGGSGHSGGAGAEEFGAVVRYLPNGRLDRSFGGGDGVALVRNQKPFTAIALNDRGRIYLTSSPVGGEGGIARLLPDGRLDISWGEKGLLYGGAGTSWYPTSIRVTSKGRIFVGGLTGYLNEAAEHWYGWLYRISSNGRSGTYFAGMTSGAGDQPKTVINDFVFAPGGAVITAGTVAERRPDAKSRAALARLLPGSVEPGGPPTGADPSFGGGVGLVQSDVYPASPFSETANALSRQRGKLLIAGEANRDLLVSRYTGDGLLDRSFGRRGFATAQIGRGTADRANALAVSARGGIYAAGSSSHGCGTAGCASLLLARYGKDGQFVRGFGRGGILSPKVDSDAYGTPASEIAYDLSLREQGKILVGGIVSGPGSNRLFLRRFLADGTPDSSFGQRGRLTTLPLAADRAR
jgi:uncharacterized delta-60 repeat protein